MSRRRAVPKLNNSTPLMVINRGSPMPDPSAAALAQFLLSTMTTDELRRFLGRLDRGHGLVAARPGRTDTATIFDRAAEALKHRGLVTDELRRRLLEERPRRADDITILWGRSADARRARMIETVSNAIEGQGGDPLRCFEA